MGKNTTFIRHLECKECGSSDANSLYSDGSMHCFSCRANKPADEQLVEEVTFKPITSHSTIEEIKELPVDSFRGISKKVLYDADVKVEYNEDREIIAHYYPITVGKKIVAYKKRIVANKDFRVIGKVDVPQLFNQSNCGKYKNLCIVEGEVDALSLLQYQSKPNVAKFDVVSIVNGAQSARRNVAANLDFVNKYQKVFIAFDSDENGIEAANEVAHIIKPGKAHITECLKFKDANDALMANSIEEYIKCVWGAKTYKPDSFISGEAIWEAFQERKEVKSLSYPMCLSGLNEKLMGMRMGEIVLFTSGTGSGKSTVVKEIILNTLENTDDKIGLISLEESIGDTATKLIGMRANKVIKNPTDINDEEAREAYESVFKDERLILLDHQGSVQDSSLIERIEYLAAIGCKYLILDHITIAISEGSEGLNGNAATDKIMSELLKITKRYNINLLLISHLRKAPSDVKSFEEGRMATMDDIKGSGSIKQISFDIVAFSRNMIEDNIEERNKIHFTVLKSRFNGDTGRAGLAKYNVDTGRLSFIEDNMTFKKIDLEKPIKEDVI